mmetsp:Transcript_4883/g.6962  ORF Transcript_4883/g.6962 Transcript_4883/m.6962 type:complete len:202 (+) Transcript_4883:276-881(+)
MVHLPEPSCFLGLLDLFTQGIPERFNGFDDLALGITKSSRELGIQVDDFYIVEHLLAAQLGENGPCCSKLREKLFLVFVVLGHNWAEHAVVLEAEVRWEHHEAASAVLVLQRASPGFALVGPLHEPILLFELHEELVGESGGRVGPWAPVAAAVGVASPEGVAAGEGDDLAVGEAHAVEDVAEVLGGVDAAAVGVGEAAVG